jgi:microcystin-dependent protein
MSTSLIRKKSTIGNRNNYYNNRVHYALSPHTPGNIPLLDGHPQNSCPVGSIIAYIMPTSPYGWLICDGSEIDRSQFQSLFSVIGTTFGQGDGIYTFNLPDYRGAFLRGSGNNGNVNHNGPSLNQSQNDSLGTHSHRATSTVNETEHSHTQTTLNDDFNNSGGNYGGNYTKPSYPPSDSAGTITWTNTINSTKTNLTVSTTIDTCGNSVETRPYNYGINWIIKCF